MAQHKFTSETDTPSNIQKTPTWLKYMPIVLIELWLTGTLFLFFFGVWSMPIDNSGQLVLYCVLAQLFVGVGYVWGISQPSRLRYAGFFSSLVNDVNKLTLIVSVITIACYGIMIGALQLTPWEILDYVFHPDKGYKLMADLIFDGKKVLPFPFGILVHGVAAPFTFALLPIAFTYWSRLRRFPKILVCTAIFSRIFYHMVIGTNIGMFHVALNLSFFLWIGLYETRCLTLKQWCFHLLLSLIAISFFITYFSYSTYCRSGNIARGQITKRYSVVKIGVLKKYPKVEHTVALISTYASQGYIGLAHALKCDWKPTYGLGHSLYWTLKCDRVFPDWKIAERTFPFQVQAKHDYSATALWHTAYPYWASDLSFTGALFWVAFLAWLFATTWNDTLEQSNPISVSLCGMLLVGFIFLPCNNQLAQSTGNWFAFFITLFFWMLSRFLFSRTDRRNSGVKT